MKGNSGVIFSNKGNDDSPPTPPKKAVVISDNITYDEDIIKRQPSKGDDRRNLTSSALNSSGRQKSIKSILKNSPGNNSGEENETDDEKEESPPHRLKKRRDSAPSNSLRFSGKRKISTRPRKEKFESHDLEEELPEPDILDKRPSPLEVKKSTKNDKAINSDSDTATDNGTSSASSSNSPSNDSEDEHSPQDIASGANSASEEGLSDDQKVINCSRKNFNVKSNDGYQVIFKEEINKTKLWNDLLGPEKIGNIVAIPLDADCQKLVRKRFSPLTIVQKIIKDQGNNKPAIDIGDISLFRAFIKYPQLTKSIGLCDDATLIEVFGEEDLGSIKKIYSENLEIEDTKNKLTNILSLATIEQKYLYNNRLRTFNNILKHYNPQNSAYVLGLVGKIKHAQFVASSIYVAASAIRFFIKQLEQYDKENEERLKVAREKVHKVLEIFAENKIVVPVNGSYEHTPHSNAIIYLLLKTWEKVSAEHPYEQIHSLKASECTFNMFTALSNFSMECKVENPNFQFSEKFGEEVIDNFSKLIVHNLSSNSGNDKYMRFLDSANSNASYLSISPEILKDKLDYIYDSVIKKSEWTKLDGEKVRKNDARLVSSIEHVLNDLVKNRRFVMSTSFSNISAFRENQVFESSLEEDDKKKKRITELTAVMTTLSNSIISQAGIKVSSFNLRILLIFKTLVLTLASYGVNKLLTRQGWSEPLKLIVNYHGVKYFNKYLQYLIDSYEKKLVDEYNKYNELDEEFNRSIEALIRGNCIYPMLDEKLIITEIRTDNNLKRVLNIIAQGFKFAYEGKKELDGRATELEISSQDLSAITKCLFIELTAYALPVPKGDPQLKFVSLKEMERISGSIGQIIKNNLTYRGNSYNLAISPEAFKKLIKEPLSEFFTAKALNEVASSRRPSVTAIDRFARRPVVPSEGTSEGTSSGTTSKARNSLPTLVLGDRPPDSPLTSVYHPYPRRDSNDATPRGFLCVNPVDGVKAELRNSSNQRHLLSRRSSMGASPGPIPVERTIKRGFNPKTAEGEGSSKGRAI